MKWLIALFILCFTATGYCESWKLFYSNSDYYDADNMGGNEQRINLWTKSTDVPPQIVGKRRFNVNYAKYHLELDCAMKTITMNGAFYYDAQDRLLKQDAMNNASRTMIPIVFYSGQTKGEKLYESLCVNRP